MNMEDLDLLDTHPLTHSSVWVVTDSHPNQPEIIYRDVMDIEQQDPTHPHVLFMMTFPMILSTHTHTLAIGGWSDLWPQGSSWRCI